MAAAVALLAVLAALVFGQLLTTSSTASTSASLLSSSSAPDVIAIADLHGDLDKARTALRVAGLMDASGSWVGAPHTEVVQLGDLVDRGERSLQLLEHMHAVQDSAAAAGGRLTLLLGNHELLNMQGDYRSARLSAAAGAAELRLLARLLYINRCILLLPLLLR